MPIHVLCTCGRRLVAKDEFAGMSAICPTCGSILQLNAASGDTTSPAQESASAVEIKELLTSTPAAEAQAERLEAAVESSRPSVARRMFEALLDPRSIQWLLMIGGGLCVLGIIVWLISKGVFENKLVLAALLAAGTLAVLGAGWWVALKTRFRVAGQALTFLGCVLAPLNLWFYHAQDLLTVDGHLWVGGVVCCLLYAATVRVLRDPLFMYAFEAGITLTLLLLLADLGKLTDTAWLSLFLAAMGVVSVHAERAFTPTDTSSFSRRRYGLPLFWSGHVQIAAALLILLGSQLLGWLSGPAEKLLGINWPGNLFTNNYLVAAAVWAVAAYIYVYSDLVVRRVGWYLPVAGFSFMMTQVTLLLGLDVPAEWIIAAMAVTSVTLNAVVARSGDINQQIARYLPAVATALGALPVLWGIFLHLRATSGLARELSWEYPTTRNFVIVMIVTAIANRISAWLASTRDERRAYDYFALSAVAVLMAAAGLLRELGYMAWDQQAVWMMLIPLAYLIGSRVWRGSRSEWPLYWVAQAATAVILVHVFLASVKSYKEFVDMTGSEQALRLAGVFGLATVFYALAAWFHRRSANVYLAAAAACGMLWQLLGYSGLSSTYYAALYAVLGTVCLIAGRVLGLDRVEVYRQDVGRTQVWRGRGIAAFQCGTAIACVSLLAALMQGLAGLADRADDWLSIGMLGITITAALASAVATPDEGWRRGFLVGATALAALALLRINLLIDLTGWQKLELISVVAGIAILVTSQIAVFREEDAQQNETATFGLGFGSLLAVLPLVVAVLYHRWLGDGPSLVDELALLTVTIAMVVTGVVFKTKASTTFGAVALVAYLVVLIASLVYNPQVAVGVYLAAGGAILFGLGIALSVYREKLLALPDHIAKREGLFQVLNWR